MKKKKWLNSKIVFTITMVFVVCCFMSASLWAETVGNTMVFGSTSYSPNLRAMPFTMPENGIIESVTMYHHSGNGDMMLCVYDGEGLPQNLLAYTSPTSVSGTEGWQTIDLISPVYVPGGATIWLAWCYESNPGIRYQSGTPGRADAGVSGCADPGSWTIAPYIYSIYATYTPSCCPPYTLTIKVVGNGTVTLDPPGGTYDAGTVVCLTVAPDPGWELESVIFEPNGTTGLCTTMNSDKTVTVTLREVGVKTVGNTEVFPHTSYSNNHRAMPFTMPEDGIIESVTMYHLGGSGEMWFCVYDGESLPQNRLAITPLTAVSGSTGWQTIDLSSPVYVPGGATIWLGWSYESNPGIKYQTGTPGRAERDPFGNWTIKPYIYSIYASYYPD